MTSLSIRELRKTSLLILISKVSDKNDKNLEEISKKLKPLIPLEDISKDIINDEVNPIDNLKSEVSVKKTYNIEKLDSEIYERYIAILARVFKTMDGVNDNDLLSEIISLRANR